MQLGFNSKRSFGKTDKCLKSFNHKVNENCSELYSTAKNLSTVSKLNAGV